MRHKGSPRPAREGIEKGRRRPDARNRAAATNSSECRQSAEGQDGRLNLNPNLSRPPPPGQASKRPQRKGLAHRCRPLATATAGINTKRERKGPAAASNRSTDIERKTGCSPTNASSAGSPPTNRTKIGVWLPTQPWHHINKPGSSQDVGRSLSGRCGFWCK